MTVLEATVEIVKSTLQGSKDAELLLAKKENTTKLAEGIEVIYKKIEELEKDKGIKGTQH